MTYTFEPRSSDSGPESEQREQGHHQEASDASELGVGQNPDRGIDHNNSSYRQGYRYTGSKH